MCNHKLSEACLLVLLVILGNARLQTLPCRHFDGAYKRLAGYRRALGIRGERGLARQHLCMLVLKKFGTAFLPK